MGLLKHADKVGRVAPHALARFAALGCERAQVVARDGGSFSCPCHVSHVSFRLSVSITRVVLCVAQRPTLAHRTRERGAVAMLLVVAAVREVPGLV